MANYYISTTGNDSNNGLTSSTPWQTCAKVNAQVFNPGDTISFKGGETFIDEGLFFQNGGTTADRITINSYGTGQATIKNNNYLADDALDVYQCGGFLVDNLIFEGPGSSVASQIGISFYVDGIPNHQYPAVTITNCEIKNWGAKGMTIGGFNGTTGYTDVLIEDCSFHDNLNGPQIFGDSRGSNNNVIFRRCSFYNNIGKAGVATLRGNGMSISETQTALVEYCIAHDNGSAQTLVAGPCGIIIYNSDSVIIQHCESYNNSCISGNDGNGFDLGGGCTNCVMQYNYSHDNYGSGYLVDGYVSGAQNSGNIVRYNISEKDCKTALTGTNGSINVFNETGAAVSQMQNLNIFGNTIYVEKISAQAPRCITIADTIGLSGAIQNINIYDNIFIALNGANLVFVGTTISNIVFNKNVFYTVSGGSTWSTATHTNDIVGNPLLTSIGNAGTVGVIDALTSITAYQLTYTSNAKDVGIDGNAIYSVPMGSQDFFGNIIPNMFSHLYSIGAAGNTPDAYTYISKPVGASYTNDNASKPTYDEPSVLYDDPLFFYDGIDTASYTNVAKPTSSNYSYVTKPT